MDPDHAVLEKLHALGGETLLTRLFDLFEEIAPQRVASMRQAVADDDRDTISREAHSLKSNGGNLGFQELYAASQRLEETVESLKSSEIEISIAVISDLVEASLGTISQLRARYCGA